jgi:hypothetical protein
MSTDLMAVDVLSDEHMMKILHLTSEEPMSIADLCNTCGINGAACFRRVADLKRMGLLKEEDTGDEEVKFSSDVKKIEVQFRDGLIFCKVEGMKGSEDLDCMDPLSGNHLAWSGEQDHIQQVELAASVRI